jgi:ubiquinone/menaquinone biosynthesis C-methylase UbiE
MNKSNNHIWSGDKKERAISSTDLKMRLDMNKKYQDRDFSAWLRKRLNIRNGENILDVGCGTGAQSLFMLEDVGNTGSVVALDISNESVKALVNEAGSKGYNNLSAFQLDMGELKDKLKKDFEFSRFSLAQSSYAIYYSPKRIEVLEEMQARLTSDGRLAVFTPCEPHGMVEHAGQFHPIPQPVIDSLKFGTEQLIPLFREAFWNVEIHFFQSELNITSAEDFLIFYQATTYYEPSSENAIIESVAKEIKSKGSFKVKKNGVLLIGSSKRASILECATRIGIY